MKNEKITIMDIAKELSISAISVSRALSGQSGVSGELRIKILEKAQEMGYLKVKNASDINILILHQSPFIQDSSNYSHMIQGIQEAVQATGCSYDLELADKHRQEQLRLPDKLAKGINYDGAILIGRFDFSYLSCLSNKIKNQVFYTGYSPSFECDSIWYNFSNSGYKQCEYLIKKGHKRIGYLRSNNSYVNREKTLGLLSALEDYQLNLKREYFIDDRDTELNFVNIVDKNDLPSAMICQSDYIAIKFIKFLAGEGIKVPDDISVIGNGNSEMSSLFIPGLTTLDLNINYACESAITLLLKRIYNPKKPFESININSKLVERESVRDLVE